MILYEVCEATDMMEWRDDIKNRNSIFNFLHHFCFSFFPVEQVIHFVAIVEGFGCFIGESSIMEYSILGISVIIPDAIMD